EPRRECLEIAPHARVGVLADDQRCAGVVNEHRCQPVARSARRHDPRHLASDVIRPAAFCRDGHLVSMKHGPCILRRVFRRSLRYAEELTDALKQQLALAYSAKDLIGFGLREKLREGYTGSDFKSALMAALVVGVVALPLSMALAIACDVPPQHGLYTAIIAGVLCALLGGTRFQVTGPTAAFVVILVPI